MTTSYWQFKCRNASYFSFKTGIPVGVLNENGVKLLFVYYITTRQMSEHGKDLMDKESRLLADLQDFNKKYDRYIACNNNYINPGNKMGCTAAEIDKQTVITAIDKLNTSSIMDVSNAITTFKSDARTITPAVYDASYQYINRTYNNDILSLRNELDVKLMEIYNTDGSITSDIMKSYDATMYVGLLWTILATSGLYFVFTKL